MPRLANDFLAIVDDMKIVHVNAISGYRSTGKICDDLISFLDQNGHDAYLAYSYGKEPSRGYKIGRELDRFIHSFFSHLFGKQAYYSRKSTIKFLNISQLK